MKGITNTQILNHREGRLGNQLFRIATIVGVAKKNNVNYYIPEQWEHIDKFPNLENLVDIESLKQNITHYHNESKFGYHDITYHDGLLELRGYFQSYKFFQDYELYIKNIFNFRETEVNKIKYDFSTEKVRLCVHVRHGDFYDKKVGGGHKNNENYHPVMSINFYENSINYILNRVKIDEILVFTDHPETKEFIFNKLEYFGLPIIYFDYSDEYFLDFISQSLCDHFVVPNSTFSWWSSFLSVRNANKIVCCPKENEWFGPAYQHFDVSSLLPQDWIRIPQN